MILKILSLQCDFCPTNLVDQQGIKDEAQFRRAAVGQGWSQSGRKDYCPTCTTSGQQIPQTNKHDQKVVQRDRGGKVWLRCGTCGHTYLCDPALVTTKRCPRKHE